MIRRLRKYCVFASKGFLQNLQYSASHVINAIASAMFGLIYIYLWKSVTPPQGFCDYTPLTIVHYITFNQTILWFTQFGIRTHRKIADSVRSGNIATEFIRPQDFFSYRVASDFGSQVYGLIFRGVPVGLMLSTVAFYLPKNGATWIWTLIALIFGSYLGIVISYLVGISSFWTTEIRTAWWISYTLSYGLGGASMPLEVLPPVIEKISKFSPFACMAFYPARIYLELSGPGIIWLSVFWSVTLTLFARWITSVARRRLEVQGG